MSNDIKAIVCKLTDSIKEITELALAIKETFDEEPIIGNLSDYVKFNIAREKLTKDLVKAILKT